MSASITTRVRGPFDVKMLPQADSGPVGRMLLDKTYHGDLEGPSVGQMLAVSTDVKGSAVYVAIERVTATLTGRSGTFALHHTGIMTRGAPQLTVLVVPDSGTDQLTGIVGTMNIEFGDGGAHFYDFSYSLPATA